VVCAVFVAGFSFSLFLMMLLHFEAHCLFLWGGAAGR
jgi:hypothetical protein